MSINKNIYRLRHEVHDTQFVKRSEWNSLFIPIKKATCLVNMQVYASHSNISDLMVILVVFEQSLASVCS